MEGSKIKFSNGKIDVPNDPIINDDHIILLNLANKKEIERIKIIGLKIFLWGGGDEFLKKTNDEEIS